MANEDIALKWLEQVDEDIATAEALYTTGHSILAFYAIRL